MPALLITVLCVVALLLHKYVEKTEVESVSVLPLQTVVGPGGVITGCGSGLMVIDAGVLMLVQPFTVVVS